MLRRLKDGDSSALDDLWSSICHQESVYSASFAAFPHLVFGAESIRSAATRAQVLCLAGSIAAGAAESELAGVPADIVSWYRDALPVGTAAATRELDGDLKSSLAIHLLQAAAAMAGYRTSGKVLEGFVAKEFTPACPDCETDLYVWPDGDGLKTAQEDPVSNKSAAFTPVRPGLPADSTLTAEYQWIRAQCTRQALKNLAPRLDALFGVATCPACGTSFSLMDALAAGLS